MDQQLCLAHGIHLGVTDVFYAEQKEDENLEVEESVDSNEVSDDDDDEESNDENEDIDDSEVEENGPEVTVTDREEAPELVASIKTLIDRLRKSINIINKSPSQIIQVAGTSEKMAERK